MRALAHGSRNQPDAIANLVPSGTHLGLVLVAPPPSCKRFFFAPPDPQGGLAMGLNGLHPRNTTGTRFTLRDRPGVSVSDRGKMGPSGDSNAHPIDSLPLGALGGCFDGGSLGNRGEQLGKLSPIRRVLLVTAGGLSNRNHLQSIFRARRDAPITLAESMEKRE
jgi:hypothetical protein